MLAESQPASRIDAHTSKAGSKYRRPHSLPAWLGHPAWPAGSGSDGRREGDRAAIPRRVHGAQAELHVVLGDVERDRGDVADLDRAGPVRRRGLPHHHLVPGQVGLGVGVPGEDGVVDAGKVDRRRYVNQQVLGRAGRGGQRPQRCPVDLGHPGDVVEVHVLDQVTELHPVDHLRVLVLVIEVLPRLGDPGGRVALPLEGEAVGATQVPVAPPDQPDVHAGQLERRHLLDEPAQLARSPVVLTADRLHERDLAGSRGGRDALQEHPHGVRVGLGAIPALTRAHDVVAEHALHVIAGRRHLLRHEGRAVQPLLFPGDGREHQGAGELTGGEQPGELEHDRDAGGVVISTGGVVGEVQHVGHPGVQVPGDDIEPLGGRGPLQRRDHVGDRGRHRDVARDGLHERLLLDGHPAR